MTNAELNAIKGILKRKDDIIHALWLETQLLRNLIVHSGWMPKADLDGEIEQGKKDPANIREVAQHFAVSEQLLAEVGLDDWLARLAQQDPPDEKGS